MAVEINYMEVSEQLFNKILAEKYVKSFKKRVMLQNDKNFIVVKKYYVKDEIVKKHLNNQ